MAKTKQTTRMIAMALAAAVTMSSMPVAAFAAEDGGSEGSSISVSNDNGSDNNSGSGSEGGSDSGSEGGTPDGGSDGGSEGGSESNIPSAPAEGETPVAKDGPINITVAIPSTPDDPATDGVDEGKNTETFGNEVGTAEGDLPEGPDDKEYEYEVTTQQGSVTVEATENENGENNVEFVTGVTGPTDSNDIIYEQGYFDKAENYYKENELEIEDFLPAIGNEEVTPEELGKLDIPNEEDESRYELITQGATSQFRPLAVFTKPMTDEDKVAEYGDAAYIKQGESYFSYYVKWLDAETRDSIAKNEDGTYATDAEGYLVDANGVRIVKKEQTVTVGGETYYMHRFDLGSQTIKGAYSDADGDGTWELDSTTYKGIWEEAAQFVLVDKTTGELITTYQEDYYVKKWTTGVEYYMQNLEDSEKFGEYADNIRAVAQSGYWGTTDGIGSLDSMKAMLKEAGFNDTELESLTDGVALAATQMAIYYYANAKFGQEFINTNYDGTPDTLVAQWGAAGGAVPAEKQDEAALLFKVYDFLKNLEPVDAATKVEDIISNENFLDGDMEITVLEKVADHENNLDDDDTNDAYTTNLTFALVVTPSTENGDDLVVKVVNANTGDVIASARVAGEQQEGENYLSADENGNYTFENIVMTEGDQQYNITMEGIQNLKEGGVYLFTADVPADTKPQPSMIGMTSDKNQVNVESLNFSFEVDDEKVVVREKHSKGGNRTPQPPVVTPETPEELEDIPEENVPLTELPEEKVPMVDVPFVDDTVIVDEDVPMSDMPGVVLGDEEVSVIAETGDSNHMTAGFGGMLAALAGMFMLRKKREN